MLETQANSEAHASIEHRDRSVDTTDGIEPWAELIALELFLFTFRRLDRG